MTYSIVLALLMLAHILSDFYFQTTSVARSKGEDWRALLRHGLIWCATAALLTAPFMDRTLFLVILTLGGLHLAVDKARAFLDARWHRWHFESLVADQLLHAGFILLSYPWLKAAAVNEGLIRFINASPLLRQYWPDLMSVTERQWVTMIAVLAVYLINIRGANFFVGQAIRQFSPARYEAPMTGDLIGRLERLLIVTFVLLEAYTAIGMVFAAKSIARIKELEDQTFAHYYLVGTLTSTLTALFTSLAVKLIIGKVM